MRLELRATTADDLYAVSRLEQPEPIARWLAGTGIAWHRAVLGDPAQEHRLVEHDGRVAGFLVLRDGPRRSLELAPAGRARRAARPRCGTGPDPGHARPGR